MRTENDLIQKLMISKKIMDKHSEMPRGGVSEGLSNYSTPEVAEYNAPQATFNIPNEYLSESEISKPVNNNPQPLTKDRILSSKLPDEIKRLMMEHPIDQPNQGGATLSDDLVQKAARLMNTNKGSINETSTPKKTQQSQPQPKQQQSSINLNEIRDVIRETVEDVLKENGLLVESTSRTNDLFTFKVGKHIFEGKLTKIKKIS
jgi:hypothetical protein